jgi:hypothetical protein
MNPGAQSWLVIALSCVAVFASILLDAPFVWTAAFIAFALLYHAVTFGARLCRSPEGIGPFIIGLISLCAAQSVFQTAFYFFSIPLGSWTDALSLTFTLVLFRLILPQTGGESYDSDEGSASLAWAAASIIPAIIAFAYVIRGAITQATDISIRTPWPLLPTQTLLALAVIPLCAWLAAWKANRRWITISLVALSLASIAFVSPLLYRIGYGFDGFLHVATERIVYDTGTLNPKPLYYIGQYVFVTWFARFTSVSVESVDRFLVPIAVTLLPLLFFYGRKTKNRWEDVSLLLFLPLATFVATTPQSLAYVCGLGAVFLSLDRRTHPAAALSLAAWALTIHPLAGLPLAGATFALQTKNHIGSVFTWMIVALAAAAVPIAFLLIGGGSATGIQWDFSKLVDLKTWLDSLSALAPPRNRAALWPDWTAIVLFLSPLLATSAAIIAIWRDDERRDRWLMLTILAAGTALGGFFLRAAGDFAFLIDYERGNYADRLFLVALLLIIPSAVAGASRLLTKIEIAPASSVAALFIGLAAWHGAQAHAALPRHDAATASYGWSVGRSDVEAVRWIDGDAQNAEYTVLANQSVSAAAVREFGFKRYKDDIFYYPLPTGGELYQYFLEAVGREQALEPIREAAQLTDASVVYVVVNDYWWDAERVAEDLSIIADKETTTSDKRVRVFRFNLTTR